MVQEGLRKLTPTKKTTKKKVIQAWSTIGKKIHLTALDTHVIPRIPFQLPSSVRSPSASSLSIAATVFSTPSLSALYPEAGPKDVWFLSGHGSMTKEN